MQQGPPFTKTPLNSWTWCTSGLASLMTLMTQLQKVTMIILSGDRAHRGPHHHVNAPFDEPGYIWPAMGKTLDWQIIGSAL